MKGQVCCVCVLTQPWFSPAPVKSCQAVALDVRSHRSLNCYHTALTPFATRYIPFKLILVSTVNMLMGQIVVVLLLIFVSQLQFLIFFSVCVCVCAVLDFHTVVCYQCVSSVQMLQFFFVSFSSFTTTLHLPILSTLMLSKHYSITVPSTHPFHFLPFSWEDLVIVLDWRKICGLYLPSPVSFQLKLQVLVSLPPTAFQSVFIIEGQSLGILHREYWPRG